MNVILCDLDRNFPGQTFQAAILTGKLSKIANITIATGQSDRYLPSNGATVIVSHYDLDLTNILRSRIVQCDYLENGES